MSSADCPTAYLAHRCSGRMRIRIPEKRGDGAFFAAVRERLATCPAVGRIETTRETGSVLVFHAQAEDPRIILDFAAKEGLFNLLQAPARPLKTVRQYATTGIRSFERSLLEASDGLLDLDSLFLLTLIGFAVRQARRGQILGPAITLIWYAIGIVRSRRGG